MAEITGARLGAEALKREGVDTFFYLLSAPLVADCLDLGMKGILVRNETAAGMMAHGYARVTGKPGIVLSSHGPGTANTIPSIINALADACPVVAIGASAGLRDRFTDTFQEMDQVALMRPATKWAQQATHAEKIPELVSIAFRQALAAPHGPVYVDLPNDVAAARVDSARITWPTDYRTEARAYADPDLVRRAVDLLASAKKPLVISGSGVLWSGAAAEMEEFVNITGIPFYTTPQGRGVVPEDHPRFYPGARSQAFREADVVLVVGTRANVLVSFLRPPRWSPDAKFIVVNLDPREIGHNAPAEIGIIADAKAAFKQLTEAARGRFDPRAESEWTTTLAQKDAARAEQTATLMDSNATPIHPLRVCREVRDFMDRDAILAVDGHETLNFARQSIPTHIAGHRINSGTHGTMGVGVPFGIGAKAARPDKQVIVLSGDGAFGWNGMEVDTAIRHNLPILFVINNNGSYTALDEGFTDPQKYLGHQRYDLMMQGLGGHGEWVEDPDAIRPALERAYAAAQASGKPALVNVKVDPYARSSTQMGMNMGH